MKKFLCGLLAAAALVALSACSDTDALKASVSEYRSNLYMGTQESYSVFAAWSTREYPYVSDGNVGEMSDLFEVTLSAADNTVTYSVKYTIDGKEYSSQLSFDSVRMVHTCSLSLPEPKESEITFKILGEEKETLAEVCAASIKNEEVLSLEKLLAAVQESEKDRIASMMRGSEFCGEIYVRLLYENEQCYYYIGLIDRDGGCYSLLADAVTGEIVATRE